MKLITFLTLIFPLTLWAIPEEDYQINWEEKVFPHFIQMNNGEIESSSGPLLHFHYSVKPGATKTIVILPGRSEPAAKYAEVIYDLDSPTTNLFILDHQGQGESERILKGTDKGYVRNFQDYVDDVALFMDKVVIQESRGADLYLLAHSMGGAIGVHYLAQNPGVFKKAFLNAPMLKLNTKPYAEIIAKIYSAVLIKRGKGADYAPGQGPYVLDEDTFETNIATHSEARFNMAKGLYRDHPELIVGGPTVQWVNTSLKATCRIQNLGSKIKIPILMTQAGLDGYVKPERQSSFCKKSTSCKLISYPQASHEILMEKDEIRDDAMARLKAFFTL